MTIDEGIKNLEYGTKQLEMEIESGLWIKGSESELCCKESIALNKQHIEWLTELKEARKLLTPTKYKIKHEEWDMYGEHYRGDYALCPNCDKVLTNIREDKVVPVVMFCPDCGQKIDWGMGSSENG